MSRPGSWLKALAALTCRPSTTERLIDPIISDLRIEYEAALGSAWRRRAVLLRAYAGFWKALAVHGALSIGRRAEDADQAIFRRAVAFSCLGLAVVTMLMVLPPLVGGLPETTSRVRQAILVLTLIPQALPISIPIGVCIGIMTGIRVQALTRRHVLGTLLLGVTAACLVWAVIEWGVPLGNQNFREIVLAEVAGREVHVEPGLNELGFSGLARRSDVAAVRHYHLLWALSFAAIPLAVFTLAVAARVWRRTFRALLVVVTVFAYYAILWVSESSLRQGAPALMVWAPNAVLLGVGLMLLWRQSPIDKASAGVGL